MDSEPSASWHFHPSAAWIEGAHWTLVHISVAPMTPRVTRSGEEIGRLLRKEIRKESRLPDCSRLFPQSISRVKDRSDTNWEADVIDQDAYGPEGQRILCTAIARLQSEVMLAK